MQSNVAASTRLDEVLREEKEQAAVDRQNLLAQITNLVMAQGDAQDVRIGSKIQEVQKDVLASKESFEASQSQYNVGMDAWNEKETQLVEEVLRSREALKTKLKEDWVVCFLRCKPLSKSLTRVRLPTNIILLFKLLQSQCTQKQFGSLMSK